MSAPASRQLAGRRQLERLRQRLSERDLAVLSSVARYRYLSAVQVQRLHFPPDNHTPLGAVRASRRTLERLTRDGVLRRLERRIGGVRAGSASYCYCLGPVGVRLLTNLTGRGPRREPSLSFLRHSLAVAEVVVDLTEAARGSDLELLAVECEPACWRRFYGQAGQAEMLKPDLRVILGLDEFEHHAFIEVDLGTEHGPTIARKADVYQRYRPSGLEQSTHGLFPQVVWLTDSQERAGVLRQVLQGFTPGLFVVGLLDEALAVISGEEGS